MSERRPRTSPMVRSWSRDLSVEQRHEGQENGPSRIDGESHGQARLRLVPDHFTDLLTSVSVNWIAGDPFLDQFQS
jgi:hypothetical protein